MSMSMNMQITDPDLDATSELTPAPPEREPCTELTELDLDKIDWAKVNGMLPVIVQDVHSLNVLMLGYMNVQALQQTLETRQLTFYSRQRQKLWIKGETSGNMLFLKQLRIDCDGDSLLAAVEPLGPTCHTGERSCFFDKKEFSSIKQTAQQQKKSTLNAEQEVNAHTDIWQIFRDLEPLIALRIHEQPEGSYTAALFKEGLNRIAQKVGEEAVETVIASLKESDQNLCDEMADLFYHCCLLLKVREVSLLEVLKVIQQRMKK